LVYSAWNGQHGMTRLFDLESRKVFVLPGSEGILGAYFLDPYRLVAFSYSSNKFVTYDLSTSKWSNLLSLPSTSLAGQLSPDRRFLFYIIGGKELQVERLALADLKEETVAEVKSFHQAVNPATGKWDFDVAPDGALIFSRDISSQEIYALNIHWP
jgi:hypothetical protein